LRKGRSLSRRPTRTGADFAEYKKPLHEAAIELIEIPQALREREKFSRHPGSASIPLDLCYSKEHIDTFVIVSGDSDFSPLVSKLKENGKTVIGLGMKESSSHLLINKL